MTKKCANYIFGCFTANQMLTSCESVWLHRCVRLCICFESVSIRYCVRYYLLPLWLCRICWRFIFSLLLLYIIRKRSDCCSLFPLLHTSFLVTLSSSHPCICTEKLFCSIFNYLSLQKCFWHLNGARFGNAASVIGENWITTSFYLLSITFLL